MSETEIVWNTDTESFEPCSTCMTIILETAYSDGFLIEEEDIDKTLEDDVFRSYYDNVSDLGRPSTESCQESEE